MADISKCDNTECPLRHSCYRFLAPDGLWQSYSDFEYSEEEGCDSYWEYKEG